MVIIETYVTPLLTHTYIPINKFIYMHSTDLAITKFFENNIGLDVLLKNSPLIRRQKDV